MVAESACDVAEGDAVDAQNDAERIQRQLGLPSKSVLAVVATESSGGLAQRRQGHADRPNFAGAREEYAGKSESQVGVRLPCDRSLDELE